VNIHLDVAYGDEPHAYFQFEEAFWAASRPTILGQPQRPIAANPFCSIFSDVVAKRNLRGLAASFRVARLPRRAADPASAE
jgi:hypothetical protein